MQKSLSLASAALVLGLVWHTSAHATLILEEGLVGGSGDVDNVIYNACGLGGSTGTTVQGCLNTDHTILVNFTSDETLVIGEGGGQAQITAQDGGFDFFRIQLADSTLGFGKLQFNVDAIADGTATFLGVDQFGTAFNLGVYDLDASGENFFTLYSEDDQVAVTFELVSTVPLENVTGLQQVRLGIASLIEIPEPASVALLGAFLVALGLARRRPNAQ